LARGDRARRALLAFFAGIVCFALPLPFDARLFPLVIGGAGICSRSPSRRRSCAGARDVPLPPPTIRARRPAGRASSPRSCVRRHSACCLLFGFVSLRCRHAGDARPDGHPHRRQIVVVAVVTVVV